jgi:hypothetical protein
VIPDTLARTRNTAPMYVGLDQRKQSIKANYALDADESLGTTKTHIGRLCKRPRPQSPHVRGAINKSVRLWNQPIRKTSTTC